jgi:hypothetical protein
MQDIFLKTGWAMSFDSGMYTIACTRQLLEHTIRNEILTHYTNIEILEDTRVTGLVVGKKLMIAEQLWALQQSFKILKESFMDN